jgi:hypothetical protein
MQQLETRLTQQEQKLRRWRVYGLGVGLVFIFLFKKIFDCVV